MRDKIDAHAELFGLFRKNQPRLPVGERVLLPVYELFLGLNG
jgi:hypothetical protein